MADFESMLNDVEVKTTFFGGRILTSKHNTGFVYLGDLAQKICKIGQERCAADDLSDFERVMGIECVTKIYQFYRISDTQIRNSNWLTRILSWIKEFSFSSYTARFHLDEKGEQYFRAFSQEKFNQAFGYQYNEYNPIGEADGEFGSPLKITARRFYIYDRHFKNIYTASASA